MLASASDCLASGVGCDKRRSFRYSSGSACSSDDGRIVSAVPDCGGSAAVGAAAEPLHQAERLVMEAAAHQHRSAFQFDTLTPVRTWYTPPAAPAGATSARHNQLPAADSTDALSTTDARRSDDDPDTETEAESSDNGGFVTQSSRSSDEDGVRLARRAKRATVVGNPMFEACGADAQTGDDGDADVAAAGDVPAESLGLDDLDMDYEQIMHYFDNLKVSAAVLCGSNARAPSKPL